MPRSASLKVTNLTAYNHYGTLNSERVNVDLSQFYLRSSSPISIVATLSSPTVSPSLGLERVAVNCSNSSETPSSVVSTGIVMLVCPAGKVNVIVVEVV